MLKDLYGENRFASPYTEVIILAGGFGTRLKSVVSDMPKAMAPVCGKPFLNYLLNFVTHHGIKHVIISTGHLSEKITEYYASLGKNPTWDGAKISFSHEKEPLGTGGAVRQAMKLCKNKSVYVLNGDSFFDFNLGHFGKMHKINKGHSSIAVREIEDTSRYGTIEMDYKCITSFKEKTGKKQEGYINTGVYCLQRDEFLKQTEADKNFSIEKDYFEKQTSTEKIIGMEYEGYFIDIGIPEDYKQVQDDFEDFKYK